jgi:hypothetical protein
VGIVDEQLLLPDDADVDDPEAPVVEAGDPALVLVPEADRLAVLEADLVGVLDALLGQRAERAVVEDRAVLVDLHERRALVDGGGAEHVGQVVAVPVDRPRHERGLGTERQRDRVEGMIGDAKRGRLRDLADL